MSSIGTNPLIALAPSNARAIFCVGGMREIVMAAIDVDGAGRIAFPVLPVQAERFVAIAEVARAIRALRRSSLRLRRDQSFGKQLLGIVALDAGFREKSDRMLS